MKTSFIAALLVSIPLFATAQTVNTGNLTPASGTPQDTPFSITQRDANENLWQRTTYEQLSSGEWIPHVESYQETATGLNYKNPDTAQWEESSEGIELVAGGAVAKHGQHKVVFAADIATVGAIDMETPDGQRLQSHLLGLAYFDKSNDQTVFIADITNSIGQLVSSNEVWYDNAFTGVKAGVRYTYTREGFEQDIILKEQPLAPEAYGLHSGSTILQAYTEFISPPVPAISMSFLPAGAGQQLQDKTLAFTTMKIGRGRAFLLGNSSQSAPVAKDWATIEGRQFLIEEVPMSQICDQLLALPPAPNASVRFSNSVVNVVAAKRLSPGTPIVKSGTNQIRMAKLPATIGGFVLDYVSPITTQTNYTFRGDTTYYISGNVNLFGTNTTFEGGTVLKYASGVSLTVGTPVTWGGSAYRPILMVSKDDNCSTEPISGSTGIPGNTFYATKALCFDGTSALTNLNIDNLRILNAQSGVVIIGQSNHVLSNVQIANCGNGVVATNTDFSLRNALFSSVLTNFSGSSATGRVEHLTSDVAVWLNKDIGANLFLTNCLLSAVTNLGSCTTQSVAVVSSGIGVFQTAGAGAYYLTNASPYRDAGTTNINPSLQIQLHRKTTYPPILVLNSNFNAVATLGPAVQRDTDTPDLGYHYDPMDYVFSGVNINTNMTLSAGTAVGWFKPASGNSYAVHLADKTVIAFNGLVDAPDYFVRTGTVQEGNGTWGSVPGFGIVGSQNQSFEDVTRSSEIDMNFTLMSALIYDQQFRDSSGYLLIRANNSTVAGGNTVGYVISYYLTNCLLDNQQIGQVQGHTGNEVYLRNCTLHNGNFYCQRSIAIPVSARDCAVDRVSLSVVDGYSSNPTNTYYDYNAYTNATDPFPIGGSHDANSVSFNWQVGPLGRFYLPTNSVLIDVGHTTADLVGLYHFTTQTNQVKETNSTVDIGYHYVAVDWSGNPIDSNGDGIPDYLQDVNGNGLWDVGLESGDWKTTGPDTIGAINFQVYTPLK
jgi:hypothetical protein